MTEHNPDDGFPLTGHGGALVTPVRVTTVIGRTRVNATAAVAANSREGP